MKISVAMTTFNGEEYIIEQLDSIKNQSLPPDEVIICDDASRDNTVEVIKKFISKYDLKTWKVISNRNQLGWKQNFRKVIGMTSGEIIFFSDQDDVWMPDKIEVMSKLMKKYDIGCLYGKNLKIDSNGNILESRNEQKRYRGSIKKVKFSRNFFTVGGLGCCMCVNQKIVHKYIELNCIEDDHDSQCARIAVLYDSLWILDKPVIYYRIHKQNTSGVSADFSYGHSTLEKRIENIITISCWLKKILADKGLNSKQRAFVKQALTFEIERNKYLKNKRIPFLVLLRYWKCYTGITMMIGDIAYKYKLNTVLGKIRWGILKFI